MSKQNYTRLVIIGILLFLYLVGVQFAQYVLVLYLLAILISVELSSVLVLVLLALIPFCVYFKWYILAEAFAVGAYMFFAGLLLSFVVRDRTNISKLIHTASDKKICNIATFLLFLYILFYRVGDQVLSSMK